MRSIITNNQADKWQHVLKDFDVIAYINKSYHSEVKNINTAYQDLEYTSQYRNIDLDQTVFDVELIQAKTDLYFPTEQFDKFSNLMISGKAKEAIAILTEIIDENVQLKIQKHQFISILQSLILYMKKHLPLDHDAQQMINEMELAFFNHTNGSIDLKEMRASLIKMVMFISKKAKQKPVNKLNRTFIAQYIELNYMDNLYLEHMAEITETSPKYFSKYFKKTFGINFVEYLNRVRVNYAREYLKNENSTISNVGEKVGYIHATTFASTFKKYTGLSPTQYRNQILDAE